MVITASKAICARMDEDAKLNSFLLDVQLWLFLYASVDWAQWFLLVFLGLTANHLAMVTLLAPELALSCTFLADSAANVRAFPDLPLDVDAKLAALPTQVWQQPLPLMEQDELADLLTLSIVPPPSTNPSGCSIESCAGSAIPLSLLPSIHPTEWASAGKVMLVLALVSSLLSGPVRCCLVHKATVVVAASLVVRSHCLDPFYLLIDSPHRSLLVPRKPGTSVLARPTRVMQSWQSSMTTSAGIASVSRSKVMSSMIQQGLAFGVPRRTGSAFARKR